MKIRFRQRIVAAAGAILGGLLAARSTLAVPWTEVGDAGDLSSPQVITGGSYDAISGNLGESADEIDAFRFHWSGGAFSAKWSGADPPDVGGVDGLLSGRFFIQLYDPANNPLLGGNLTVGISTGALAEGDYILQLIINSGQGLDPAYTVGFSGPIGTKKTGGTGAPDRAPSVLLLSFALVALFSVSAARRIRRP